MREDIEEEGTVITELCKAMEGIYDMAYNQYKPLVDASCKRKMSEKWGCSYECIL